jgi:mannose-6-phosphate isomerase-like protein (cupin superfamily)
VNLKQVEDQASKFGYAPNIEARFARGPLALEQSGLTYFRYAPSFRMPFGHKHAEQEEVYLVLDGSARLKLDDEIVELERWDAVRIPPGTMRSLQSGPDGVELLAFGAPNTENRDVEMTPDWWTD